MKHYFELVISLVDP